MGSAARAEALPLTEPVPIEDTFVTGLGGVETDDGCVRLNFTVERMLVDGTDEGTRARVIVSRLVLPRGGLRRLIRQLEIAEEAPHQAWPPARAL
ncbi:hypothetical protein IZ6_07520 [Terrihabitans soli]|uniref:Uncharacterized protein n=1 Tax=Terrihabitans soli TaxID=708113 RepID=A0A6S6QPZ4_9HYPH|nr:hypothetical protein [Terrihabitans soli]BCJ90017.1 hypothetical protein IZ6_07520 [Terrihabitans soli]